MKLTTGRMALALAMVVAGSAAPKAAAQNTDAIDNARSIAKSLQQKQANDSNAALNAAGVPSTAKPSPSAPAPTVKPAVVHGTNPVAAPKPATASPQTKATQPKTTQAKTAVQKPVQTAQAKIPAASTTHKAASPAPAKAVVTTPKAVTVAKAPMKSAPKAAAKPKAKTVVAAAPAPEKPKTEAKDVEASTTAKADDKKPEEKKPEEKKWAMNGKRDPFFSPVVQQGGSGCSTGKKCLEIGAINLRGVIKSESGFIAVVTNNLNKAYFLRENDPVFNGFVVKITGDSVVFQETIEDKLGKPFTREIVKRIFTPAV
ncbi:MAG TPA: hypothetical protein VMD76_13845 [Candidatus Sulfotelmatobacter sp.]|nr:hypothetical protein [Candidatus Sulfotelmatobacter sp.]